MTTRTTLLILIALFTLSCNNTKHSEENEKEFTTIDMNQYETVDFNSLVESISSVKLNNDKIAPFSFCDKILQHDDYYYLIVNNRTGDEVQIFDASGEFVKQIDYNGEHYFISTIHIHPKESQLWVICEQRYLYKHKLDGTLVEKVILPFSIVDVAELNNQDFLVYHGGFNRDWEYNVALTDMNEVEKFFLSKHTNMPMNYKQSILFSDKEDVYIFPRCIDTIYHFDNDKRELEPLLHLDFHGDFLTEKMYPKDRYFTDKEYADIMTEKKYIHNSRGFSKISNKIFFQLEGKRNNFNMINLKDNSLSSFDTLFDGYIPSGSFLGTNGKDILMATKEKSLTTYYKDRESMFPSLKEEISRMSEEGDAWVILNVKIKN